MGFWIFMLCADLMIPVIMIVFGVIFLRHPPREINGVYGYRTERSMSSKEAWNFAHAYFGKLWFCTGCVMAVLSVPAMLPCLGKGEGAVGIWGGVVCTAECVIMILPIIPTERELKKRFRI